MLKAGRALLCAKMRPQKQGFGRRYPRLIQLIWQRCRASRIPAALIGLGDCDGLELMVWRRPRKVGKLRERTFPATFARFGHSLQDRCGPRIAPCPLFPESDAKSEPFASDLRTQTQSLFFNLLWQLGQ